MFVAHCLFCFIIFQNLERPTNLLFKNVDKLKKSFFDYKQTKQIIFHEFMKTARKKACKFNLIVFEKTENLY